MTKFLLIRHALTDSVGKRLSGRSEGLFLNDTGREQAGRLVKRLAGLRISAIYSSPLERAIQTANPLAEFHNLSCITSDDFLEIDFGRWTNSTIEELKEDPEFKRFNSFRSCTRIPEGELMLEAQMRIVKGLEKLRNQYPDGTVAVISHGDLIKAAIAYYAGIPPDMFQRIEISPASVSIIERYDDTVRILLLNDAGQILDK